MVDSGISTTGPSERISMEEVSSYVKSVADRKSNEVDEYSKILSMVDQIQPRDECDVESRNSDRDKCDVAHKLLVQSMRTCGRFLAGKLADFPARLTLKFSLRADFAYKILCHKIEQPKYEHEFQTIYSLISSSLGKETLIVLLEQEIEACTEIQSLNPKLHEVIQMRIVNILLEDIYTTEDFFVQRSKILIAKGRLLRARVDEGLDEFILLLSEMISTLQRIQSDMCNKDKEACGQVCNILAEAYCLRALYTHNLKSPYEDKQPSFEGIGHTLKLWLRQEHSQSAERTDMVHHNTLNLLHHVGDLLSLKGYMDFHEDIYKLMIRFCTCKKVSLEDCLAMLWQTKSLNHTLCTSHVYGAFILTFSKHCKSSKSVKFWKECMAKSEHLNVGFQQCFSVISALYPPRSSCQCDHDPDTDPSSLTVDYIKRTALNLNEGSDSEQALYISSTLYYDLSEKLKSNGSMLEASKALTSRAKLLCYISHSHGQLRNKMKSLVITGK